MNISAEQLAEMAHEVADNIEGLHGLFVGVRRFDGNDPESLELVIAPEIVEVEGGEDDGAEIWHPLDVDIQGVTEVFSKVDYLHVRSANPGEPPCIQFEGSYKGFESVIVSIYLEAVDHEVINKISNIDGSYGSKNG